jgi:hypothetical protein
VDKYDDAMSKMALGLTSSQVAKNFMVEDFGIGEDLPFTFFMWSGGDLTLAIQLRRELMQQPVEARLSRCQTMCMAICSAVPSVTAISFVAEGFETLDKDRLDGRDLRSAFIEEDDLVRECITVTHCEKLPQTKGLEITLLSLPYEYKLGRVIDWGKPLGFVSGMDKVLKTSSVSKMLRNALGQAGGEYYSDDDIDILFNKITSIGFNIEGF